MARDDTNHRGRQSFAILFDRGDEIVVQASNDGIRFLLISGQPLEEPVALVRADSDVEDHHSRNALPEKMNEDYGKRYEGALARLN